MSGSGNSGERPELAALNALEQAVTAALERLENVSRRASEAEAKATELQRVLDRFTGDSGEARRLVGQFGALEEENVDLRRRVDEGRQGIERLLAQIRFLEDQR
ncbi:MAG: hypothetical protein WD995_11455 [Gemmatimonadota bacterium]